MYKSVLLLGLVVTLSPFSIAIAQPAFQTEFPAGAIELSPESLKAALTGKAFVLTPAKGPELRLQYRDDWAYIDAGNLHDNGPWHAEGSSACVEWKVVTPGCSPVRMVGETLYTKRASNGEVLPMKAR